MSLSQRFWDVSLTSNSIQISKWYYFKSNIGFKWSSHSVLFYNLFSVRTFLVFEHCADNTFVCSLKIANTGLFHCAVAVWTNHCINEHSTVTTSLCKAFGRTNPLKITKKLMEEAAKDVLPLKRHPDDTTASGPEPLWGSFVLLEFTENLMYFCPKSLSQSVPVSPTSESPCEAAFVYRLTFCQAFHIRPLHIHIQPENRPVNILLELEGEQQRNDLSSGTDSHAVVVCTHGQITEWVLCTSGWKSTQV